MDWWGILAILSGVVGAGLFVSIFIPGAATYVSSFFQAIVNIFRSLFEFILGNLPKPLKVAFFLIIFTIIGGMVYSFSVGATHVCVDKKVYEVPWTIGSSMVLWPRLEGDYLSVLLDTGEILEQNLIRQANVTEDGEEYLVTYATVTDKRVTGNLKGLASTLPQQQFSTSFLGLDITAVAMYSICYSNQDGSCMLVRPTLGTGSGCDISFGNQDNIWTIWVGSIRYFYEPGVFDNETREQVDKMSLRVETAPSLNARHLEDCGTSSSVILENSQTYQVHLKQREWTTLGTAVPLFGLIPGISLIPVKKANSYDFLLYNAYSDSELMVTTKPIGGLPAGTVYFAVRQGAVAEILDEVKSKGTLVSDSGGAVQYMCNLDTKDEPYDTELRILGFNPFSMTTMILILIIEFLLTVFFFRGR